MFDLDEDEFVEAADSGSVVKLSAEVETDVKPLEAYSALRGDYSFLLESAEKEISALKQVGENGDHEKEARYSFVGFDPEAVVRVNDRSVTVERLRDSAPSVGVDVAEDGRVKDGYDSLDALRDAFPDVTPVNFGASERQVFAGGLVGFLAYDVVEDLWIRDTEGNDADGRHDDAVFVLSTRNVVFDHDDGTVELVFTPVVEEGDDPRDVYASAVGEAHDALQRIEEYEPRSRGGFEVVGERAGDREEYEEAVERAREHILDGDIYQAVLSRKREMEVRGDVRDFYAELREINPSPYMYLLEFDGFSVVGSSPETLLSVHDGRVKTNPIAGTCPRGETAVEDRRLAGEMLSDEKELSEHVMLVDLGRNDVRRVSESGSVRVDDFMSVVQYSHVQHIESTVSGELRDGKDVSEEASEGRKTETLDAFDATRSIFPAGTLSGAPKIRAMEIIDELEGRPRGAYGGGVGYYSWNLDADFAITIRTATFEERDGHELMTVQAGAGIVADSVPEKEFDETESKMDALLTALERLREEVAAE